LLHTHATLKHNVLSRICRSIERHFEQFINMLIVMSYLKCSGCCLAAVVILGTAGRLRQQHGWMWPAVEPQHTCCRECWLHCKNQFYKLHRLNILGKCIETECTTDWLPECDTVFCTFKNLESPVSTKISLIKSANKLSLNMRRFFMQGQGTSFTTYERLARCIKHF